MSVASKQQMTTRAAVCILIFWALTPLYSQESYAHHNLTLGIGGSVPQSSLDSFMQSSPQVSIGYGYRFHKNFQADIGLDIVFGAARVRDFLTTDIGDFRVKDREYFVPMGGRAILPVAGGRLLFSAGGGGIYMRYNTRVSQPSYYFRIDCPICTSRSGWGYYTQVNASYFFDEGRHFRIGVTPRLIRGHTEGEPLGAIPAIRTTDHWVDVRGELGFSF